MDRDDNPPELLESALRDLRQINSRLGGANGLLQDLEPWLLQFDRGQRVEVLDVGTGAGDLPVTMVEAGNRLGREVRVTAIDRDPVTVAFAARSRNGSAASIGVVQADAFRLPFTDGTFDIVTASMLLHHFRHEPIVALLREMRRVARRAVIVNDLQRHRVPWAFILTVAVLTGRNAMFRHDAPLSVLRGFVDEELVRAAEEAGATTTRVRHHWPYRLLLTLDGGGTGR